MRNLLCAIFVMVYVLLPRECFAMDFDVHFETMEDNFIGEVWYDNALFWRFALSPTGALPTSSNTAYFHTVITPEIEDGFFIFRVQ
ncbi:hypothetical protein [Anaerosinus massiliensis]|uniref:hypothetical protein n=1 Tax=Massilibacillus massiliensis TaxID=1806837 RepID=UPI000DA601F1|nr:hypothetical protein [Massilibacillus massiliensis]